MTRIFEQDPLDFRSLPKSVRIIGGACVVVYVLMVIGSLAPALDLGLMERFALLPARVLRWPAPQAWRLFTFPFVHADFMSLLVTLIALWFFGAPVVAQWGDADYARYFFLCSLGAAVPMLALGQPVAGASAASYGTLLAFALLYPEARVYFFLIPMRPWMMITLFVLLDVLAGTSLNVVRLVYIAGGMATGYAYIRWWWAWKLNMKSFAKGLFERGDDDEPAPARPRPARRAARPASRAQADDEMVQVDRILDKILVSGLESLTDEERSVMSRYSRKGKPS